MEDPKKAPAKNTPEYELWTFLIHLGIGLDDVFWIYDSSTGVSAYQGEEPYPWVTDSEQKIKSILLDRFRFKDTIEISEQLSSLNTEKDYIIASLDYKQLVLIDMYGFDDKNNRVGHSAIIDAYRLNENGIEVKINMGWGINAASDEWYSGQSAITVQNTTRTMIFNRIYIFKNTVPINYNG